MTVGSSISEFAAISATASRSSRAGDPSRRAGDTASEYDTLTGSTAQPSRACT